MGSFMVQAEIGDYDPQEHNNTDYLKDIEFAPNQTPELIEKVRELHKTHKWVMGLAAKVHYTAGIETLDACDAWLKRVKFEINIRVKQFLT